MKFLKQLVKKELNIDSNEEIRRIRTLLLQNNEANVIQIANSIDSQSIYHIAYKLAESFASVNKKTVLLNLNLRSEKLFFEKLRDQTFVGIDEYLINDAKLNNLTESISKDFDFITNRMSISNSTDLLDEDKLTVLFNNLRSKYDYVFVIAPSLHLCYDALIIGKFVDGLIYIKEDRLPSKSILKKHASLLEQIGKPIYGLIITNIEI